MTAITISHHESFLGMINIVQFNQSTYRNFGNILKFVSVPDIGNNNVCTFNQILKVVVLLSMIKINSFRPHRRPSVVWCAMRTLYTATLFYSQRILFSPLKQKPLHTVLITVSVVRRARELLHIIKQWN